MIEELAPFHARWAEERARRLHRVFIGAEARMARGQRMRRAFKWFAWWLSSEPRFYLREADRPFRLSYKSLVRLLYQWRKGGRRPEALAVRYRCAAKLGRGALAEFAWLCLKSEAKSFPGAYGKVRRPAATWSGYYGALPEPVRRRLVRVFQARRLAGHREAKALAAVNDFAREEGQR